MESSQPIKIAEDLWWVGSEGLKRNLRCNSYLYLGRGSAILFEPGSALDFETVHAKVTSLVPLKDLDAIVCSHQDPDLCASLPLFERAGFRGPLCCHGRAAEIITYYGVNLPFYLVDHHEYAFPLVDGSNLQFIFAPYLHFPGAIMSYLEHPKALVSGDLFGAFGTSAGLFAHPGYEEGMKTFHEVYMPSHDILKAVMGQLSHLDIQVICPQHGSVINERIRHHIDILSELQCGIFLNPIRKTLMDEGGYLSLCNKIVTRYINIFGHAEVRKLFTKSPFTYQAKTQSIISTTLAEEARWKTFFELVHDRKGMGWITVIAPLAELISKEYSVALPDIFRTVVFGTLAERESKDSRLQELELEKSSLEQHLAQMEQSLYRDPVTGLYNQAFHQVYVKEAMEEIARKGGDLSFLMLSIDNLANINLDFGSAEGDATMRQLASIIRQRIEPTSQAFRLAGGTFGLYCSHYGKEELIQRIQGLLRFIAGSESFIVPISVSIGMFHTSELPQQIIGDIEQMSETTGQVARYRLKLAQKRGGGILVHESATTSTSNPVFTILLIDEPGLGRDLIKRALERQRYRVIVVDNGLEGRHAVEQEIPDIIISELMVPKVNAITLRKELLARSETRKIPFLLMSYTKNESTVGRAIEVNITHFFWRPVMLVELLGVVNLIAKRLQIQGA